MIIFHWIWIETGNYFPPRKRHPITLARNSKISLCAETQEWKICNDQAYNCSERLTSLGILKKLRPPWYPSNITALYGIEGFYETSYSCSHYAERRKSLWQLYASSFLIFPVLAKTEKNEYGKKLYLLTGLENFRHLQLERLTPLGIIGGQFRGHLKPLGTILPWCTTLNPSVPYYRDASP